MKTNTDSGLSEWSSEKARYTHGIGQLISGFEEGVSYMKPGGKASLIIPSDLGYGPVGGNIIPGFTTLVFDVELISITK